MRTRQTSVSRLTAVDQRIPGAVRASLRPIEWLGLRTHSRPRLSPKRSTEPRGNPPRNWRTVVVSKEKGPDRWNDRGPGNRVSRPGKIAETSVYIVSACTTQLLPICSMRGCRSALIEPTRPGRTSRLGKPGRLPIPRLRGCALRDSPGNKNPWSSREGGERN